MSLDVKSVCDLSIVKMLHDKFLLQKSDFERIHLHIAKYQNFNKVSINLSYFHYDIKTQSRPI